MAESGGRAPGEIVVRLSVPGAGDLRGIAADLARKVAEHLQMGPPEALAGAVEQLASEVGGGTAEIEFLFRRRGGALSVEARSEGRTAESRHPLPA